MENKKDHFYFHVPIDIAKSETKLFSTDWILEGKAGDSTRDAQGETLDYDSPNFDISKMYYVNWEHGKEPSDIVGVIAKKNVKRGDGLYVKTKLFKKSDKAKEIWDLAQNLHEEGFNLQFSVEGKVLERDKTNPSKVLKAELYGVAICKVGVNPKTFASIVKSMAGQDDLIEKEEDEEDEEEKAMTTANMAPAIPESVEKKKKDTEDGKIEKTGKYNQPLSKGKIYNDIFCIFTKNSQYADDIYNLMKSIDMEITSETIEKAKQILGLATDLEKGKGADYKEKAPMKKMKDVDGVDEDEDEDEDEEVEKSEEEGGGTEVLMKAISDAEATINEAKQRLDLLKKGQKIDLIESKQNDLESIVKAIVNDVNANVDFKLKALAEATLGKIDEIQKSNDSVISDMESTQKFVEALSKRLGFVENQPIKKSITTENYKERFPEVKAKDGKRTYQPIQNRKDKFDLIADVNAKFSDIEKAEHRQVLGAIAEFEAANRFSPKGLALLKSHGYEIIG